jgi:hypothetical protein
MARRNRPSRPEDEYEEIDAGRILGGFRRTEDKRGQSWTVQPISEARAVKEYTCPGCHTVIAEGVAHLAVWRNDGIMGESVDVEARRHWHTHCWRIG